jgi:hypothetical protein
MQRRLNAIDIDIALNQLYVGIMGGGELPSPFLIVALEVQSEISSQNRHASLPSHIS